MGTDLINNYISASKQPTTAPSKREFVKKAPVKITSVAPETGKGHLVKGNVFNAPVVMVKDLAYDVKSLHNGLKGSSNDHQLGRINDLGMKIGGLALASYLFTKKQAPTSKLMEFVGFGSFFASMALWPKIAIQAPSKLIHGFNVFKNYEDSQGRKKPVFQDPQYIPWDLYDSKTIDKIGDRLGVPKDIDNRRNVIQDKMKKIAIQNNTLWMLTAGFATPIMSALICNQAEKAVAKGQALYTNYKAIKTLENLEAKAEKHSFATEDKKFSAFIDENKGKPITSEFIGKLAEQVAPGIDPVTLTGIKKDLSNAFVTSNGSVDAEMFDAVSKILMAKADKNFKGEEAEQVRRIIPSGEELKNTLSDRISDNMDGEAIKNLNREIGNIVYKKAKNLINNELKDDALFEIDDIDFLTADEDSLKIFQSKPASVLDSKNIEKLSEIRNKIKTFVARQSVLDDYTRLKVAAAPETVLANQWNDISGSLIDAFGISKKEIADNRYDRLFVQKLIREKLENIASDETKYKETLEKLAKKINEIDVKIPETELWNYHSAVTGVYDKFAGDLAKLGFKNTLDFVKADAAGGNGSLKKMQHSYVDERIAGVKNTFYRLINALDVYKRVAVGAKGELRPDSSKRPGDFQAGFLADENYAREVREEIIEFTKKLVLNGRMTDYENKFYVRRNPEPRNERGPIEVEGGKVKNKFINVPQEFIDKLKKERPGQYIDFEQEFREAFFVDMPQDSNFFKNVMSFAYNYDMSETTKGVLSKITSGDEKNKKSLLQKIYDYRTSFYKKIGGVRNDFKPNSVVEGGEGWATAIEKFNLVGLATDDLMTKACNQAFNTNKWLKMFTVFGGGLLGVTLASQFLFGKGKNVQAQQKG